mmetsp:Transcript_18684/g.30485  ORF Transcript_18684/g.30485 Transcript_18684/m.30485 type:complete len:766 (-) Transcript_18684:1517-3814(-)
MSSLVEQVWRLVRAEDSPLSVRDKILVPLLTFLSVAFRDLHPEQVVGSGLISIAVIILTGIVIGCCGNGHCKAMSRAIGLVGLLVGCACLEVLKLELLDQSDHIHAAMPYENVPELPNFNKLLCDGPHFKDEGGRILMLRGVNLGGCTKIPTKPHSATWNGKHFYDTKEVSFVGRPFPLEEADEHLGRLRSWGFVFLRFLITWEAVEHSGPGEYDVEYLEYLVAVIRKCREHGISVFIDPHQDVWSRWTGGDGAPAWTLEKVGFNLRSLHDSGAAISHQEYGDPFPQMVWPTNYNRLGAATMFTLFFAGNTYAPNTYVDGVPVQDYLQNHYINAIREVAKYLKAEPNVLGYDTLNEPSTGYIGLSNLNRALFPAPLGWFMSGIQGMVLGAGRTLDIPFFSAPLVFTRYDELNSKKVSAWQSEDKDIWRNEGVWDIDPKTKEPRLLRPEHFARNKKGEKANFMKDFMVPFFQKFQKSIHSVHPDVIIFAEPYIDPNSPVHAPGPEELEHERFAWAPHYYDGLTLLLKKARPWVALDIQLEAPVFSAIAAQSALSKNLAHVKQSGETLRNGAGAPVVVGEIGIPMDLDRDGEGMGEAYKTGDFSAQIHALDRTMRALEHNLLSFTLWNYSPSNSNKRGDLWNDEDLSLWSRDQQKVSYLENVNSGGRALSAAVRPYPMKTCGVPKDLSFFPLHSHRPFQFKFQSTSSCDSTVSPTILFVPKYQYPNGFVVNVTAGLRYTHDEKKNIILLEHDKPDQEYTVRIESTKN